MFQYPAEILDFQFDKSFAVRGLHFDTQKGLLMKIDSFHNIQLGTVYRYRGQTVSFLRVMLSVLRCRLTY